MLFVKVVAIFVLCASALAAETEQSQKQGPLRHAARRTDGAVAEVHGVMTTVVDGIQGGAPLKAAVDGLASTTTTTVGTNKNLADVDGVVAKVPGVATTATDALVKTTPDVAPLTAAADASTNATKVDKIFTAGLSSSATCMTTLGNIGTECGSTKCCISGTFCTLAAYNYNTYDGCCPTGNTACGATASTSKCCPAYTTCTPSATNYNLGNICCSLGTTSCGTGCCPAGSKCTDPIAFNGCTSTSSSSGSSSSGSSCFAATERLTLESGQTKAISEARVGDRVLSVNAKGQAVYSDVVSVPHGPNTQPASFALIATASGRDLKMTLDHFLPAGTCALSSLPLVAASRVAVGDCVQTVTGREQVVSVGTVEGQGVYTIVTMEELIVVNGIVATPFGGVNPTLANIYYHYHRLAYSLSAAYPALLAAGHSLQLGAQSYWRGLSVLSA